AELRRRQGRSDEARVLLDQCGPFPSAQLGLAALALDRADFAGALGHVERYERRTAEEDELERALAAEITIRANLGLGRTEEAEHACARLERVAARVPTECWRASAAVARGLVESSRGAHDRARRAFEDAIDGFARAGAQFEAALARVELARCLDSLGAPNAEAEREIADRVLSELGAIKVKPLAPGPLSARELEVIALVGKGLNNGEIAERLGLSEHTVKRHVANILNKLDVPTRAAAVARANELALL
ncbi:MAG TPA: response regulator transcription factor, partial [Kofleriaceae bacterium]|nr:response regulator transcription factor [Kofleriaceae bacterium]